MRTAGSVVQGWVSKREYENANLTRALNGLNIEEGGEAILNGGVDDTLLKRLSPSAPLDVER